MLFVRLKHFFFFSILTYKIGYHFALTLTKIVIKLKKDCAIILEKEQKNKPLVPLSVHLT